MGEGSYIKESTHLTSVWSHIGVMWRCMGKRRNIAGTRHVNGNGGTSDSSIGVARRYCVHEWLSRARYLKSA